MAVRKETEKTMKTGHQQKRQPKVWSTHWGCQKTSRYRSLTMWRKCIERAKEAKIKVNIVKMILEQHKDNTKV